METKKGKSKAKKILLAIALIIAVLVLGVWLVFHNYYSKVSHGEKMTETSIVSTENMSEEEKAMISDAEIEIADSTDWMQESKDVMNILLIGVDNDKLGTLDQRGNSDGMVVMSINKNTGKIVLTSLMRDIYVTVPNRYNTKLTMSYHFGGTDMLIETIEYNFGIHIDNYILVNYLNVIDLVDAVGGITMDLTEQEIYYMESKIENLNKLSQSEEDNRLYMSQAGPVHMNGVQTAAYLRLRMAGNNDYERTERARKVLIKLIGTIRTMSLTEISDLANTMLPCVTTDIGEIQAMGMLANALTYMNYDIESVRIPIDGTSYGADYCGSVVVVDFETNGRYFNSIVYGEETD